VKLNPFRPFSTYLRPYRRQIALGLVLLLGNQAIAAVIPMVLKWAIDAAEAGLEGKSPPGPFRAGSTEGYLLFYAGLMAGLALVQWIISALMRWYLTGASRWVERDLRRGYVERLLELPLAFFQQKRVGDLMARATNDVEAIQRFLHHAFRMSLTGVLTFFLSMSLMCAIDWELALLALSPMPIMVLVTRWVGGKVHGGFRQVQEQFAEMSARIQENLAGIRVVKAHALRQDEVKRFARLNEEYVDRNRRLVNIRSLFFPFTFLINGASMLVILWLGGLRVIEGTLTLGDFVAFNAYLIRMGRPMTLLGRIVDEYQRAVASLGRLEAILRQKPQAQEAEAGEAISIQGEIQFHGTRFAYNGRAVLEDIDILVPAGSTLGVVGRVGSGKTTLARLIPCLVRAGEGRVLIDGVPVEKIPLRSLRQAIGYVPQETFLFSDTIRENITLGLEKSAAEVDEVVKIAQLKGDLQNFPQGLDTLVGERGVTLSGGQRQRTALARALLRRPRILILDDALASVDTSTEEQILRGLRQIMAECTTILIAHRLSTVKQADRIAVLDEGRIVECGTHDELVALDGLYADMYRRQNLTRELDDL
jgi:ATP-binding cassette subfamily B protein